MAIKMRVNAKHDCVCAECGQERKKVLDMFDVCVAGHIFTICDVCNELLFYKTLKAECYKNGRVKSKEDMAIIHSRARNDWKIKGAQELKRQQEAETYYSEQEDKENG